MTIDPYQGREQSRAKHCALRSYLEVLALKVGQLRHRMTINYVDAFAGPWEARTDDLSDTSPFIAVDQLLRVAEMVAPRGNSLAVRAFFVTESGAGERQLSQLRERFPTAEIVIARGTFEENIDDACQFVQQGFDPYSFVFLDPTGWTGMPMKRLAPLLRATQRGEVLVNFMLEHIRRFGDEEKQAEQFDAFFGRDHVRHAWAGLQGEQRDARMLELYMEQLRITGDYRYCVSAPIFSVMKDRIHFELVYATRNVHGLTTFRECERSTLDLQVDDRSRRQQERRVERVGQGELFSGRETATHFVEDRRAVHLERATAAIEAIFADRALVPWDEIIGVALREPMVSESDVKAWLRQNEARYRVIGLEGRARVPKVGKRHAIERQ